MRLDRIWIQTHIPHQGRMCLLDEVIDWNAERISCRTITHRAPDNPLRAHGRLGIASGVEYAGQVMAVHGALIAAADPAHPAAGAAPGETPPASASAAVEPAYAANSGKPKSGFLASIRGMQCKALRLDNVPGDLICEAVRVAGDGDTALYEFEIRSATARLLDGRATVVLDASGRLQR